MNLFLATCKEYPELTPDDAILIEELKLAGINPIPAIWNESRDWSKAHGVWIRSCWDYWEHSAEFIAWLDDLDRNGIRVWNSTTILKWNLDKRYLRELKQNGVEIPPTLWIEKKGSSWQDDIRGQGWTNCVIKPVISAGAHLTFALPTSSPELHDRIQVILDFCGAAMVQPFLDEVQKTGEYSYLFFNGEFSHAILKTAKAGEFRIQEKFGGSTCFHSPSEWELNEVKRILNCISEPLLYARIDCVLIEGKIVLMELEVLEPNLCFLGNRTSARRAVKAVKALSLM